MAQINKASTHLPILELFKNRWSARSFSDKSISKETMHTILEAATWAASASNEQPWLYQFALEGSPGFDAVFNCLLPGNQPWNKHAAAFIVAIARTTLSASGKPNPYAEHDLGMANAHILLQASAMDIITHPMAGFDKIKMKDVLKLSDTENVICVIALGYLDTPEKLEEPFKSREIATRVRKGLEEVVKEIS
jgi:nitroreductase